MAAAGTADRPAVSQPTVGFEWQPFPECSSSVRATNPFHCSSQETPAGGREHAKGDQRYWTINLLTQSSVHKNKNHHHQQLVNYLANSGKHYATREDELISGVFNHYELDIQCWEERKELGGEYFTVLWQTKLKQNAKKNLGVHFCDVW